MKELIKPIENEADYNEENVIGLCELDRCTGFTCRDTQSADMDDDEILF